MISIGRSASPLAPWEVREEVELYARENGRTATVELVQAPMFVCWIAKFSLKPNDPRMRAYQEGRGAEPPTELVWLMDHATGKPYDIHQLGASGVRALLEKGNTFSGRGEFSSPLDAANRVAAENDRKREDFERDVRAESLYRVKQDKRQYMNIPQVSVGVDLTSDGAE